MRSLTPSLRSSSAPATQRGYFGTGSYKDNVRILVRTGYDISAFGCLAVIVACRQVGDVLTGEYQSGRGRHVLHGKFPCYGCFFRIGRAEYQHGVMPLVVFQLFH